MFFIDPPWGRQDFLATRPYSPQYIDLVTVHLVVCAQKGESFDLTLRDEHTIEWVTMKRRKLGYLEGMRLFDRQRRDGLRS
jgi:hypothetical protein